MLYKIIWNKAWPYLYVIHRIFTQSIRVSPFDRRHRHPRRVVARCGVLSALFMQRSSWSRRVIEMCGMFYYLELVY